MLAAYDDGSDLVLEQRLVPVIILMPGTVHRKVGACLCLLFSAGAAPPGAPRLHSCLVVLIFSVAAFSQRSWIGNTLQTGTCVLSHDPPQPCSR